MKQKQKEFQKEYVNLKLDNKTLRNEIKTTFISFKLVDAIVKHT